MSNTIILTDKVTNVINPKNEAAKLARFEKAKLKKELAEKLKNIELPIIEKLSGKKLSELQSAKIGLNKAHKNEIGGFNFILGQIKKHGQPFITLLNSKHLLNISMDDIQLLTSKQLSIFMSDKERERNNLTNLFTMWQISTLIGRYFISLKVSKVATK